MKADQVTLAGVAGGASITIQAADSGQGEAESQPGGVVIEALDRSRFSVVLDTVDSLSSGVATAFGLGGFDAGLGRIDLFRDTRALLGDGLKTVTIAGV
ncbi:hypothetical protein EBT25_05405, partial [bacterium]|nr:hypothetical protein [bacterium]